MQAATTTMTMGAAFDGPVDDGVERGDGLERGDMHAARAGGAMHDVGAEAAAHAILRMVADLPGHMGRLRASRIVGGYAVPLRDEEDAADLAAYAVQLDWPLREITRLVDALLNGGFLRQTPGPRPVLVITRAGFRTLEALEAGPPPR
jgi:hypothetical protein